MGSSAARLHSRVERKIQKTTQKNWENGIDFATIWRFQVSIARFQSVAIPAYALKINVKNIVT